MNQTITHSKNEKPLLVHRRKLINQRNQSSNFRTCFFSRIDLLVLLAMMRNRKINRFQSSSPTRKVYSILYHSQPNQSLVQDFVILVISRNLEVDWTCPRKATRRKIKSRNFSRKNANEIPANVYMVVRKENLIKKKLTLKNTYTCACVVVWFCYSK